MFAAKNELLTRPSGSYQISRSLRLRSSASAYLSRTPASAGSSTTTWTWSGWTKRGTLGTSTGFFSAASAANTYTTIQWAPDQIEVINSSGTVNADFYTPAVYRDPSAWYHIVVVWDTNNATPASRIRIYVNGVQQTTTIATAISLGQTSILNTTVAHNLGRQASTSASYFDGYLAEVNFIDGQALTPSSFGAFDTNGVWQPAKYTGSYGTNGFYLNFSDNSGATATTIGKDSSGNSNNWTPTNIVVTSGTTCDSMIDSPTNYADGGTGRGNYAVLNPLSSNATTLNNGNLSFVGDTGATTAKGALGTISVSSGKWYFESTITTVGNSFVGVAPLYNAGLTGIDIEGIANAYAYFSTNGNKYLGTGGGTTASAYGYSYTTNDVIGVALDMDNGAIYFGKQTGGTGSMVWQNSGDPTSGASKTGAAFTGITGNYTPAPCGYNGSAQSLNFGQRPFSATPPSGFLALNTQNLPTPTIAAGNKYFDVNTYTGDGTNGRVISGLNLTPDLFWTKARSAAYSHAISDTVRGVGFALHSDTTAAEDSSYGLAGAGTNSYTINGVNQLNASSTTYVAWLWKGGNGTVSNTSGSITSSVSANPSAGFSVVTYTGNGTAGATVGHGLGVTPGLMIVKSRSAVNSWVVWHTSISQGSNYALYLNTTDAKFNTWNVWNTTSPASSTFTLGNDAVVNGSASTYVAYCFAPVAGYSAFGSYTGNGSATDGPMIFTNMKPRWVMIKRYDAGSANDWYIFDTSRNTYNAVNSGLFPSLSSAEITQTTYDIDFLSNGFKFRNANNALNASGGTYIYAAFAENPFKYSRAR